MSGLGTVKVQGLSHRLRKGSMKPQAPLAGLVAEERVAVPMMEAKEIAEAIRSHRTPRAHGALKIRIGRITSVTAPVRKDRIGEIKERTRQREVDSPGLNRAMRAGEVRVGQTPRLRKPGKPN